MASCAFAVNPGAMILKPQCLSNKNFLLNLTHMDMTSNASLSIAHSRRPKPFMYENVEVENIPRSVDWRKKGAVTDIKDQGSCGCCWAFAAVTAVERLYFLKTNNLLSLSVQQFIDCNLENQGCDYGNIKKAFIYIKQRGLTSEAVYPFKEAQGRCDFEICHPLVKIDAYQKVPVDEVSLLKAVAHQPVAVGINGSDYLFQKYTGGVFEIKCDTTATHAVTIVGYDTTSDGTDYWILKNSWGVKWGEDGYMRMLRGVGLCGIISKAYFPIIKSPSSSPDEL